jgi:thiol-disulfide isomerase/thioredoxin
VNIWAAWCEPCKKELPLLRRFATRLAEEGTRVELAFVSLDDDERQLQRFLDQPGSGIEQTYWLREGKERTEWLAEAELAEDPRLPVHLLVGPSGRVLCRIDGSIEESDYAAAKAVFDGRAVP